jgi:nucleotide-binding universal stress UspA family protein
LLSAAHFINSVNLLTNYIVSRYSSLDTPLTPSDKEGVMFQNILVAVDGSAHAAQALAEAVDLADCERARLTLFTAVGPPPALAGVGATGDAIAAVVEGAEAKAEAVLRRARACVPNDIPVDCVLAKESVGPALLRQIEAGHHDLVVMGSRGRGAVRSTLLGSVSHHVLHHSRVPVLIVHAQRPAPDEPSATAAADRALEPA